MLVKESHADRVGQHYATLATIMGLPNRVSALLAKTLAHGSLGVAGNPG